MPLAIIRNECYNIFLGTDMTTKAKTNRIGRPPLNATAMTNAQRQKRYRDKQRQLKKEQANESV